jgi:hypothetical protein
MIIFHQGKDVITYSKEEALLGHDFIGTEHLMLGILRMVVKQFKY